MADLLDAVYSRLSTATGVSALVSTRVYPTRAPQRPTHPLVIFQVISGDRESAFDSDTGMVAKRVRTISRADTLIEARDLSIQVRSQLKRWRGTEAAVTIEASFMQNELHLFEPEPATYDVLQDFLIHHRE